MATFRITLYGMLQTAYGSRNMEVETALPVKVEDLQRLVLSRIPACEQAVALSFQNRLLRQQEVLTEEANLLALPPVCGG